MLCPECGRELARRRGKHGEFMGCSGYNQYPQCKYTCNIPESFTAKDKAMREIEKMGTDYLKQHGYGKNGERG